MFSEIADRFQESTNPLYRERDARLARGEPVIDLISGNVHLHGLFYPESKLKEALAEAAALAKIYRPHPLGQPAAREAICRYYQEEGLSLSADRIVLTPGTSISYWYAFKLLANPGDEILCPTPTYPLFDSIASLSEVRLVHYPLKESDREAESRTFDREARSRTSHREAGSRTFDREAESRTSHRWEIDLDRLESEITSKTRGIILISPHNPTGAVATEAEVERLAEIAIRHRLPILSDEVFAPFLFKRGRLPRPAATRAPLVLTLNGLSKMFALPGMKIGWIALSGEEPLVKKAIEALETISDTFLPVNEIAQCALPALFREGKRFLTEYRSEIRRRRETAIEVLSKAPGLSFIPPEGGFYLTVRVDRRIERREAERFMDEEKIALDLLRRHGILIHPGFFYDLAPGYFVLSFVSAPPVLKEALGKIVDYFSHI